VFKAELGVTFDDNAVLVLTASSAAKQSLHILLRARHLAMRYSHVCALAKFAFRPATEAGLVANELGIDLCVYSPVQQFRMPGNTKVSLDQTTLTMDPARPLRPIAFRGVPVRASLREYLVTWFPDDSDGGGGNSSSAVLLSAPADALAWVGGNSKVHHGHGHGHGDQGGAHVAREEGAAANVLHVSHVEEACRLMRSLHSDLTEHTACGWEHGDHRLWHFQRAVRLA
jgi:hypothetical protein